MMGTLRIERTITGTRRLGGLRHCQFSSSPQSSSSSSSAAASLSSSKTSGGGGGGRRSFARTTLMGAVSLGIPLVAISYTVRKRRQRNLQTTLPVAQCANQNQDGYVWFPIDDLITNLQRTALMGNTVKGAHSVKQELDMIRKWHTDRNFKGGLVLRDLEQPLYDDNNNSVVTTMDAEEMLEDPMRLARRECYYLYYERLPSAEMRQQIFCRGTTLKVDVLTCLQFVYVYDEELDARLHLGFRNHAERLVNDLLPLLVNPNDKRATIELYGHSLGGAVAAIVALKLKKRGYNVTRLTTAASPRFCDEKSAVKLSWMLPEATLRIEDDRDLVPLLPPFGVHLKCDKLWLVQNDKPRFIQKENLPAWVDSVWTNFRAWELFTSTATRHRCRSHAAQVEKIKEVVPPSSRGAQESELSSVEV